jgi:FkbM family methyltransferase
MGKREGAAWDLARRLRGRVRDTRHATERRVGFRFFTRPAQPRGLDVFDDLAKAFGGYRPVTVFDVGANDGDTTAECLGEYPESRVFACEPVNRAFDRLQNRFAGDDRVTCLQVALGSEPGEASIVTHESAVLSSLAPHALVRSTAGSHEETVTVETVDRIVATQGIDRVGLLKIDTEGYDLEVLKGATDLLGREAIDLIEVEVSMSPENLSHVAFADVVALLSGYGFRIFGLYDQIPEWTLGRPQLRRANVVFVSAAMIAAHDTGPPAGLLA